MSEQPPNRILYSVVAQSAPTNCAQMNAGTMAPGGSDSLRCGRPRTIEPIQPSETLVHECLIRPRAINPVRKPFLIVNVEVEFRQACRVLVQEETRVEEELHTPSSIEMDVD
jgi:hypothetical protein